MRIVSLIPSGTEITAALGYEDRLVGRSHECDHPAAIKNLPVCTAPKFDPHGTGAEIDARVREILQNALSVYHVDDALLKELAPDLIVTQTQCDICAVSASDVQTCVAEWVDADTRVVAMAAEDIDGLWTDIESLALAIGNLEGAHALTARLKTRMADIAGTIPSIGVSQPTLVCLEWFDPLMTAGNWVPELVTMAGGNNLISTPGAHSGAIPWVDLLDADPDVIVLMPCGFDLERTTQEARTDLFGRPEWKQLRAVQNGAVFATDGNHYFNRPGPRLAESLEILAEILHPGRFVFGHKDRSWKQVT